MSASVDQAPISGPFASDLVVEVLALHLHAIRFSRGLPDGSTRLVTPQPLMAIAFAAAAVGIVHLNPRNECLLLFFAWQG